MRSENALIDLLKQAAGTQAGVTGIGDDAAVFPCDATHSYVVTKDILVEHRHFLLNHGSAAQLAQKALHVNLSDIAAMGATPSFVLLGIALPSSLRDAWVQEFLSGFAAACQKANVQLIGGDTSASERDLFISVTVIGRGETGNLKYRTDAKVGDVVCVAGRLGEAYAGFMALEKNPAGMDAVKAAFLTPQARLEEGLWLGTQHGVTAMMDVSDGLYADLGKLAQASNVGAMVAVDNLAPSPALTEASTALRLDARECMLTGGEDYALLLTVSLEACDALAKNFHSRFGYTPARVGIVTKEGGVALRAGGKAYKLATAPFSHFGESD